METKNELALDREQQQVKIKPFEHKTRYYETDLMGIIHQTNYVKWLEDARIDMLDQIGLGGKQMETMQILCPLLSQKIEYISMVHFHETVVIQTKISAYDGRQMDIEYRIFDKETGDLRAKAKSSHCFMNRSGIPISLKRVYPELDTKFFEFK